MFSLRLHLRIVCVVLVLPAVIASANPANMASLSKHFGPFMVQQAQTCKLCHVADEGHDASSLDEFQHNAFGDAVRVAGERLLEESNDDAIPGANVGDRR